MASEQSRLLFQSLRSPSGPEQATAATYRVSAGGAVVIGAAPVLGARFSIEMALQWPAGSFSVEARGMLPAKALVGAYDVTIARWEGAFLPCIARGIFFGCAAFSAGGFWSEISGPHHENHTFFHAGIGARAGIQWAITPTFGLLVHADADTTLSPAIVRTDQARLWAESLVQVALGVTISRTFPGVLREIPRRFH